MPVNGPRRSVAMADAALIVLFLAGIFMPGLGTLWPHRQPMGEARKPPPLTVAFDVESAKSSADWLRWYVGEHFGFRDLLLCAHGLAKVRVLRVSSSPKVVLGEDGWFFYLGENSLAYYRNEKPFSAAELAQYQHILEARRDWLGERGISYMMVFAPNKASVYPEYLPSWLRASLRPSRLDQLVRHMRAHSTVTVLDLREPLVAGKGIGRLFHRTDTHWNDLGAFLGIQAILRALRPSVPTIRVPNLSGYRIATEITAGGGCARFLGLDTVIKEENVRVLPARPRLAHVRDRSGQPYVADADVEVERDGITSDCSSAEAGSAVVFRDSFSTALIPELAEHFQRSIYAWTFKFDKPLIEREKPQVVIQEMVERYLLGDPPRE